MIDSIFKPNFDLTPEISSTLDDIERQKWLIDNMLIMPKYEAWIRREIQVKRASGTTRIEGAGLDEAEVSKLINKTSIGKLDEDEQANVNALEAYKFIDFLSDQPDIPIDELVIRELNRYFMRGADEVLTPGVYRRGQNRVGNFNPPDQGDVPSLMRSFALWLRQESDIHPVLKAGIAHIHLVAIHPFWDGNGRTARGLSTLILQRSPYGFKKLLSLESYLFAIRDLYFAAIERTLENSFSEKYDITHWLDFFVFALRIEVDGLIGQLTDWHRMMDRLHESLAKSGVLPRQTDALFFAEWTGQITRSDYLEVTGVSSATASRDLAELVKEGFLVAEGNRRTRVYRPNRLESVPSNEPLEEQIPLIPEESNS
ncbi:MAG: Fic family protein [Chloroflexi bacterium]|nr:Fic family protein [Chloroflexota bacterium]